MRKFLLFLTLLLGTLAHAQGGWLGGQAQWTTGQFIQNPNVHVYTCVGITCNSDATIYTDNTLSTTKLNPFSGDSIGNYQFGCALGTYKVVISSQNLTAQTYYSTCPMSGGDIADITGSLVFGGKTTKQIAGGPESISFQYNTNPRVFMAMFKGSDVNAKMLVDDNSGTGFELGPGGTDPNFSDQDTSYKRYDSDGIVRQVSNRGYEFDRSDAPGGISFDVSVNPISKGVLTSDGTNVSNNDTVVIGSTTYTFKNSLVGCSANNVAIGGSAIASLTNLKAAINADGQAGTNYCAGTSANASAVVAAAYRADTTLLYTNIYGKVWGQSVTSTTTAAHLSWGAGTFVNTTYLVRVNGGVETGFGALDVYSIGSSVPVLRLGQLTAGSALISGYVTGDSQNRYTVDSNGATSWGSGSSPADVTVFRFGAGQLALGTGGQFLPQSDGQLLGAPGTNRWAGAFTTGSFSGQITSTVSTGTAPLVVASTTLVANLHAATADLATNSNQLESATWEIPGTIGSTTPNSGAFTTVSANSWTCTINNCNFNQRNNGSAVIEFVSKTAATAMGIDSGENAFANIGAGKTFQVGTAGSPYPFIISASGVVTEYNGIATSGNGLDVVYASQSQKNETGADATLLSWVPPAAVGGYVACVSFDVSAANTATFGWTMAYTDSNGHAQAPTNMPLTKIGVAAPALTFSAAANDTYGYCYPFTTDNSGTAVVVKTTFTGTSIAYKASATIARKQ